MDLTLYMKEEQIEYSGLYNIKGDNSKKIIICAEQGYPLLFNSPF